MSEMSDASTSTTEQPSASASAAAAVPVGRDLKSPTPQLLENLSKNIAKAEANIPEWKAELASLPLSTIPLLEWQSLANETDEEKLKDKEHVKKQRKRLLNEMLFPPCPARELLEDIKGCYDRIEENLNEGRVLSASDINGVLVSAEDSKRAERNLKDLLRQRNNLLSKIDEAERWVMGEQIRVQETLWLGKVQTGIRELQISSFQSPSAELPAIPKSIFFNEWKKFESVWQLPEDWIEEQGSVIETPATDCFFDSGGGGVKQLNFEPVYLRHEVLRVWEKIDKEVNRSKEGNAYSYGRYRESLITVRGSPGIGKSVAAWNWVLRQCKKEEMFKKAVLFNCPKDATQFQVTVLLKKDNKVEFWQCVVDCDMLQDVDRTKELKQFIANALADSHLLFIDGITVPSIILNIANSIALHCLDMYNHVPLVIMTTSRGVLVDQKHIKLLHYVGVTMLGWTLQEFCDLVKEHRDRFSDVIPLLQNDARLLEEDNALLDDLKSLIVAKHYYCGFSARLMLKFTLEDALERIDGCIKAWRASKDDGIDSPQIRHTLVDQNTNMWLSKYVAKEMFEKDLEVDFGKWWATAREDDNGSLLGGVFEMYVLKLLKRLMKMEFVQLRKVHEKYNPTPEYVGNDHPCKNLKAVGFTEHKRYSAISEISWKGKPTLWIPSSHQNPGFDAVVLAGSKEIIALQLTVGKSHPLGLHHLFKFVVELQSKGVLASSGVKVNYIAVTAQNVNFEEMKFTPMPHHQVENNNKEFVVDYLSPPPNKKRKVGDEIVTSVVSGSLLEAIKTAGKATVFVWVGSVEQP